MDDPAGFIILYFSTHQTACHSGIFSAFPGAKRIIAAKIIIGSPAIIPLGAEPKSVIEPEFGVVTTWGIVAAAFKDP